MWKFLNLDVSKNRKIYGWLESCGIELFGKRDLRDFMVSPHVDICLSSFPNQEELKADWIVNSELRRESTEAHY
jgi:hypothetical protein